MKTLKVSLVALIIAAGLGGAVAEKIQAAPKANDQLYNWTHYDTNGNVIPGAENGKSVSQAELDFGCSGAGVVCGVGTAPSKPNATIRYN